MYFQDVSIFQCFYSIFDSKKCFILQQIYKEIQSLPQTNPVFFSTQCQRSQIFKTWKIKKVKLEMLKVYTIRLRRYWDLEFVAKTRFLPIYRLILTWISLSKLQLDFDIIMYNPYIMYRILAYSMTPALGCTKDP